MKIIKRNESNKKDTDKYTTSMYLVPLCPRVEMRTARMDIKSGGETVWEAQKEHFSRAPCLHILVCFLWWGSFYEMYHLSDHFAEFESFT